MLKRARGILLVCLIVLFTSVVQPINIFAETTKSSESTDYLRSVMDMIIQKYNGQVSEEQLLEGALKGMFNTMDPYTTYYTNQEAISFFGEMEGSYEGIGITMEKDGYYVKAVEVFQGSPAEKVGLSGGDTIVEVNGVDINGIEISEVVSMIKGEAGTFVMLGVVREDQSEIIRYKIERGTVKLDPGIFKVENDIGYIKLNIFNSNAAEFINRALKEMDRRGVVKLVLDLRDNPGGEVGQAVEIARNFVPKGLITKLDFKDAGKEDLQYYSDLKSLKYKLVVLVNENSASASEIVAGAIQDTKSGTLVGTTTFGKAKVQSIIPMLTPDALKTYESKLGVKFVDAYDLYSKYGVEPSDDEIMGWSKITTGEYYTPGGRMIDKKGLEPDVAVSNLEYDDDINLEKLSKFSSSGIDSSKPLGTDVYNLELVLKLLGYFDLKPDMIFDEETEEAIINFQESIRIEQTGILDDTTRVVLNKRIESISKLVDRQYVKAIEILMGKN